MKEPFFNDLSSTPLCKTDDELTERIDSFIKILQFCGSLGYLKVRFEKPFQEILLKENYTLKEHIAANGFDDRYRLILNMVRRPYLDEDTVAETRYVNTIVRLNRDGKEIEAEGLACAFLADGFAIGFASEDFWKDHVSFQLSVTNQAKNSTNTEQVFCISDVTQFDTQDFIDWAIANLPIKFKESGIAPANKKCHVRDDHGSDILEAFAKKIFKEDYIVEVINSLPFKPYATEMIGNITDEGLIDIILVDTDKGFGMVVKTTAETRRLARYMAADIRKKYN